MSLNPFIGGIGDLLRIGSNMPLFLRRRGIVPGAPVGIAVHRSSLSFLGRCGPAVPCPAFASSEHLVQAKKAEDEKGDERDAEEKDIPTGPGRVRVHCDLL
jgi:hypothetical protein